VGAVILEASNNPYPKTRAWLERLQNSDLFTSLDKYGEMGVSALAAYTPVETGLTADSWSYTITIAGDVTSIAWTNSNLIDGTPLVLLLQYGHGTGTGGYVQGQDFINPAMAPVFDEILTEARREIQR